MEVQSVVPVPESPTDKAVFSTANIAMDAVPPSEVTAGPDQQINLPPPTPAPLADQPSPFDIPIGTPKADDEIPNESADNEAKSAEVSFAQRRAKVPKIAEVRWVDYEHWRNRYSPGEGLEIIEVLRGHENLGQEVIYEHRRGFRRRRDTGWAKSAGDSDQTWSHRVRIQSAPLLQLLSRLSGHRDQWAPETPRVFFRPYRAFYYFLPQMKECLAILEEKWGEIEAEGGEDQAVEEEVGEETDQQTAAEDDKSEDGSDAGDDKPGGMDPHEAVIGPSVDSITSLRHLRKYVEFVEAEVVPMWKRAEGTSHRKVRWSDLWMYFQGGELLYVPPATDSTQYSESTNVTETSKRAGTGVKMYQGIWRLYSLVRDRVREDDPDDVFNDTSRQFYLFAYYIDYDGSAYGPVRHTFSIKDYEGEKDIASLPVYPLRFAKDMDKIRGRYIAQGEQFRELMKKRHLYYDGWTLTHGPMGDEEEKAPVISEHIDSEVIIDFVEGYKADSSLTPPQFLELAHFDDKGWPKGTDPHPIRHWTSPSRSELVGEIGENTQADEWFGDLLKNRHRKESQLIQAWEGGKATDVQGDDLAILPRRVIAYAFRERRFFMVDIESLREVPVHQNAFKDLQIDESHKRMVKSLVKSHFRKKQIQKQQASFGINQDLIKGKGSGLVILLHGVPGVGKTTTAEAVAQAHKKPLFTITCGDLGFVPTDVETNLRDIFRLAHLWDCVLLLDEADIFLSRRDISDLKRNALVSVFLRVLEYYSGILFLTTNRVGTLDEAFKSRIHVSLYYPPLSEEQTLAIFKVNIQKVREIEKQKEERKLNTGPPLEIDEWQILDFASWHYNNHEPHERWNGRQIRNAFQIAHSLAQFDLNKTSLDTWEDENDHLDDSGNAKDGRPQRPLTLNYEQFNTVAETIEKFDLYLYDTMGSTPGDQARILNTRADDYEWEGSEMYYPPMPSSRRQPARQPGYSGQNQRRPQPPSQPSNRGPPPPRKQYRPPTVRGEPSARDTPRQAQAARARRTPQRSDDLSARPSPSQGGLRPRQPIRRRDDSGYSGWSTNPRTPDRSSAAEEDFSGEEELPPDDQGEFLDDDQEYEEDDRRGYRRDGRY
ncbi:hypothetical protein BJX64DRAFT_270538 [Aspergillus heterothallicus]